MVSSERGQRSFAARTQRAGDEEIAIGDGRPSSTSKERCAKSAVRRQILHGTQDRNPARLCLWMSTMERTASSGWTMGWAQDGAPSGRTQKVVTLTKTFWPATRVSKWRNTVKLKRKYIYQQEKAFLTGWDCDMDSTFCLEKSLPNVDDAQWKRRFSAILAHQHYSFSLHE